MRTLFLGFSLATALLVPAMAHDYSAPGLSIAHPWSRPAAAGGNGAGFAVITNTEATPVTLVSIATPRARRVELHRTEELRGVFSMKAQPAGVVIPARGTLTLAPGGHHAMLVGLTERNREGERFPATMTFRRGNRTQSVDVSFAVQALPPPATKPEPEHVH